MTRSAIIILLIGATALAGCDVSFYQTDYTEPTIESVTVHPATPAVGEVVAISAEVYEPDSWYSVSYDTDGDGRFDDSASVVYDSIGPKTVRVRARSAGGEDVVTYSFSVVASAVTGSWLTVSNDTTAGVGLFIYAPNGVLVVDDAYLAPGTSYGYSATVAGTYWIEADNQYASYGPQRIYVGTSDVSVSVSALN